MKYYIKTLAIILIFIGCNNEPKQPDPAPANEISSAQPVSTEKRMPPPLGMGVTQKKSEGMVMARAIVQPGAGRLVLENKDTLIITTTVKNFPYVVTDTTIKKYVSTPTPPTNKPPIANAGIDKAITLPTSSVQLSGTGVDSDGLIATYTWSKVSGGVAVISSPSSATTNVSGLVQGEYVFSLTVKDNGGLTATDDVKVIVNPVVPVPTTGYLSLPKSPKIIATSGQIIQGLTFENMADIAIRVGNVSNVTIRNCFFNKAAAEAIVIEDATNVVVENCLFNGVTTGVYALSSQGVKIRNNQFVNVRQRSIGGRGQFVQFNAVYGAGNLIENNKGENFAGESDPEDLISLFKSSGTLSSPISVRNNMFRGGGPSASGGGIMMGDYGGSYQVAEGNKLLNPGQYGMAIAGGNNISILNNMIYAKQQPFTNNPLYMWAQQGAACSNNTVKGNKVYWIDRSGAFNGGWDSGNCSGSVFEYPSRDLTEAAMGFPAHLIDFITPTELLTIRK